jgi:ferric-dicitrate binding protein FerR (iron transport regulator)
MLITPRGGQFQLVLPDGTKVWLNAASSIRYPTAFGENERRVEISGEAYFEVTTVHRGGAKIPFIVNILSTPGNGGHKGEIEVLGTHFNINAYDDEPVIKTTLLEGSVKVSRGERNVLLLPEQQAHYSNDGLHDNTPIHVIQNVNVDDVVAWKNGFFQYKSVDLPSVMRQVARWYDLNIVYSGGIPTDRFTGKIPRSVGIARLLKWLEWSDIHFKIEGKTILVTP